MFIYANCFYGKNKYVNIVERWTNVIVYYYLKKKKIYSPIIYYDYFFIILKLMTVDSWNL